MDEIRKQFRFSLSPVAPETIPKFSLNLTSECGKGQEPFQDRPQKRLTNRI